MSKTVVFIPSAKLVPLDLQAEFGALPSALVPLHEKTSLQHVLEFYQAQVDNQESLLFNHALHFVVAIHEEAEKILLECQERGWQHVTCVNVGATKSLKETVCRGLKNISTDRLIIHFADTYITDAFKCMDCFFYARVEDPYRWTTFDIGPNGLSDIFEKGTLKPVADFYQIFVGVFFLAHPKDFLLVLNASVEKNLDGFYSALQTYHQQHILQPLLCNDWRDLGHLDTYYASKKLFSMGARDFNQIQLDSRRGVLRKTSQHQDKFSDEMNWYLNLPKDLQYLAPRVFDFSQSQPLWIELEFYGYPSLSELYLYADLDAGDWAKIFSALHEVLNTFREHPSVQTVTYEKLQNSCIEMYLLKTMKRLESFWLQPQFHIFSSSQLTLNQNKIESLMHVHQHLEQILHELQVTTVALPAILHGDLCFSNILYDRRNQLVRLIDPRGCFGDLKLFGDQRYDLAKLCHSILGDYDFLTREKFILKQQGSAFTLQIPLREKHFMAKAVFLKKFADVFEKHQQCLCLLEALLFISMVPLHQDRPLAQQAFLLVGLEKWTRFYNEWVTK